MVAFDIDRVQPILAARSPIHQRSSLEDSLHSLAGGPHLGLVAQITKMGRDGWIRVCNQVKDTDTDAAVL